MQYSKTPPSISVSRPDAGFSIVEMLIVLALVGIAIVPLSEVQMRSHRSVEAADRYSEAVALAQQHLEEMRAMGFSNVSTDTLQFDGFVVARGSTLYLDPATGTPLPGIEQLQVAVTWNETGEARRLDMNCLQAQR